MIGNKITFWQLLGNQNITIPTIQRDYVYGAGTEKTEEVLNNMLETLYTALESSNEETLDFVYGSESAAKHFTPLDGQQRLTTLYLLHYYAALIATYKDDTEKDNVIKQVNKFSYATRNCTIAFCNNLLVDKFDEIKSVVVNPGSSTSFRDYLTDLDDFREAFYTDPTIMSMIVVLDRIHKKFHGMTDLLDKLTGDNCPINFYLLDFGKYGLSDDLYNKMNSRGKPLTEFEIIKAKMHKIIMGKYTPKSKADIIAVKFDTSWMQYIWETLNCTPNLKEVDPAFIWLLKNLFRFFDYITGNKKQRFDNLTDDCLIANLSITTNVDNMEKVLDTFSGKVSTIPSEIESYYKNLIKDCINEDMKNSRMLLLYAIYLGLANGLSHDDFYCNFRHVKNMINNSEDYIREENMCELLVDVANVMKGTILLCSPQKMNKDSWKEEQIKEKNKSVWKTLFDYEDIDEINGSIHAFAAGLNPTGDLDLSDSTFVSKLKDRLEKAAHFFRETGLEEYCRRAVLLSIGCYAMTKYNEPQYRYFGVIKTSWQNFTGYHRYSERHHVMDVFDQIDIRCSIKSLENDFTKNPPETWRFYAQKYAKEITVAYRAIDYGYMYFNSVSATNPFDDRAPYLDVMVLQSSYFSQNNVAWKMMHYILHERCKDKYHMFLYHMGGAPIMLPKISSDAILDMQSDGWHLIGVHNISGTGLPSKVSEITPYTAEVKDSNGNVTTPLQLSDYLVQHTAGADYIIEGETIFQELSKIYPALKI